MKEYVDSRLRAPADSRFHAIGDPSIDHKVYCLGTVESEIEASVPSERKCNDDIARVLHDPSDIDTVFGQGYWIDHRKFEAIPKGTLLEFVRKQFWSNERDSQSVVLTLKD
jgi:hypothetical protein